MLSAPPRKASAMPRPMMMSGIARTSVAELSAYHEPNAPRHSAPSAATASYPASWRPAASSRTPNSVANRGALAATGHHELPDARAAGAGRHRADGAPRRNQQTAG